MQVEIVNWEKFNPRKDLKSSSWFRLENNFCTHPDFFDLTNDQKMVWIYLLCEASRKQSNVVTCNAALVAAMLKIPHEVVTDTLQLFEKKEIVTLRTRNAHVTRTLRTRNAHVRTLKVTTKACRPTNERTNERTDGTEGTDVGTSAPPSLTPRQLAQIWNELSSPKQPKVDLEKLDSTTGRWQAAAARLRANPDLAYWRMVIERISKSDFCLGKNDREWVADFDFLVRRDTHLKASEGKYDNRRKSKADIFETYGLSPVSGGST